MALSALKLLVIIIVLFAVSSFAAGQDNVRELKVKSGATVEIIDNYGRVGLRATKAETGRITATSPAGVKDNEVKVTEKGHVIIEAVPAERNKRIDILVEVPERCDVIVTTTTGAVEFAGNFASIEATTETATVALDIPDDDIKYFFRWTESKPRYLADFDIAEPKEKNAGRFEIKGHYGSNGKSKKIKIEPDDPVAGTPDGTKPPVTNVPAVTSVSVNITTARGIVLLNVPPNEVMSDLRERPLTNAAKAIVRSGDSLLMEAIRRAAPKYYGDYARSLGPILSQPKLSQRSNSLDSPAAETKTALVRVTDLKNRAISNLNANDFEVIEGGTSREVLSVEHSTAPFNLVLLLDVSGSVENYVNFIRKAARNFVDTVDSRDRVSIVIFNDDVKVMSNFTTDRAVLNASLDTFDAGGGTAYYDALAFTVSDTLRPLKGERTAIVILTDGDDNKSFLAFDSLLGSIQESGALVYPLYVPSGLIAASVNGVDVDPLRNKYMSLTAKSEGEGDKLARVSGGVYYPITQIGQIQQAYEDIVVQLRSAYNVTFRSDPAFTGGPRLKVKIKRDNAYATVTSIKAAN